MVGTMNMVQRIGLKRKGEQSSRVDVTSLSFAAHSSLGVCAHQSFVTGNTVLFGIPEYSLRLRNTDAFALKHLFFSGSAEIVNYFT